MAMLRLRPIRRKKRRGPSRKVLRVADAAFWLVFASALVLGADRVATGVPMLFDMVLPAQSAQAGVAATVREALPSPARTTRPLQRLAQATKPTIAPAIAIAIVIDDLGGIPAQTIRAIALPRQVALAFLPYPRETPALARRAARAGHELLVHVPMQAVGEADPGPLALSTGLTREENLRRLDWALTRVPGFVGINNHEGSRFTADRDALAPVMERLAARHVFFLDSRTTVDTQVVPAARDAGVETGSRDVFLDNVATLDAIDAQLRVLEAKARAQGTAIAIGHPHELTLDAIAYWTAHHPGFELVTLGKALRREGGLRTAALR